MKEKKNEDKFFSLGLQKMCFGLGNPQYIHL